MCNKNMFARPWILDGTSEFGHEKSSNDQIICLQMLMTINHSSTLWLRNLSAFHSVSSSNKLTAHRTAPANGQADNDFRRCTIRIAHLKAVDDMLSMASTIRNRAESVPIVTSVPQKSLSIEPTIPTTLRKAHFSPFSAETVPVNATQRHRTRPNDTSVTLLLQLAVLLYAVVPIMLCVRLNVGVLQLVSVCISITVLIGFYCLSVFGRVKPTLFVGYMMTARLSSHSVLLYSCVLCCFCIVLFYSAFGRNKLVITDFP